MTFMRGCKEGDKLEKVVLVKVSELVFDSELYPRNKVSWLTAYSYSQAMRAGEVFPPIRVGLFQGKKYVVDGWHRVEAKRLLGEEYVEAVVKRYNDFKSMFVDAVKYNISHGRALSVQEKARIIHKLEEFQFTPAEISQIVKKQCYCRANCLVCLIRSSLNWLNLEDNLLRKNDNEYK